MSDDERNELLQMLQAHGQQFLASFDHPAQSLGNKRKANAEAGPSKPNKNRKQEQDAADTGGEEEWSGFGSGDEDSEDEDEWEQDEDSEEDEPAQTTSGRQPDVVQFSELGKGSSTSAATSKALQKAFMSSKVTKLTSDIKDPQSSRAKPATEDEDEDLSNAQNDALLHRLVHTQLLSGSLNPELNPNLTPAQRRKALAGRVLEAAGHARLGKGEAAVRAKERNRAAKHVREGLVAKIRERSGRALEEAKNMGNYHPSLKRLYNTDNDEDNAKMKPKRERGLKMGVGSFAGGILKLSKSDIAGVTGRSGGSGRGRGNGRGRGRGRGGGRGGGSRRS